jgi:hypothetical protein
MLFEGFVILAGGIGMVVLVQFIGNGPSGINLQFNMGFRFGLERLQSNGGGHREVEVRKQSTSKW